MRHRSKVLSAMLLTGALFIVAAVAQEHEEHHKTPAVTTAPTSEQHTPMAGRPSMDMGGCPHMKAGEIADQLLTSFAALEEEQDIAVLKLKLVAHGELLKQLKQATGEKCPMMEHMGMMDDMRGMMGGMGRTQHSAPSK